MSAELSEIDSDTEALKFAFGCIWAAVVITEQTKTFQLHDQERRVRNGKASWTQDPRVTGLACGLISVAVGIAYLKIADAPISYIVVNLLAAAIGVVCFVGMNGVTKRPARMTTTIWLGLTPLLLGTTLFGVAVDGASRWLRVGSLTLQPSLILVPALLVVYSQRRSIIATVSIVLVACAVALQPDRAMAAVLASGTTVLAFKIRERIVSAAALFSIATFGVTLYRADTLPATPYVEGILFTAFGLNVTTGIAALLGVGILILPSILGRSAKPDATNAYRVFGAVWLAVIVAAAVGNYPTPLVGYGGSAIVGYFLSIAFLPDPLLPPVAAGSAVICDGEEHDEKSRPLDNLRGRLIGVCASEFGMRSGPWLGTVGRP